MSIEVNQDTLNRFSFLMAFYEHAYRLRELNIIKRKVVAPEFNDTKKLKERLSRIMLKGLRSDQIYDIGEVFSNDNTNLKIKSISRKLGSVFELERYMQFVLEIESSTYADFIPIVKDDERNDRYELFHVDSESAKRMVFQSLFRFNNAETRADILERPFFKWLMNNYELCAIKHRTSQRDLKSAPLQNMTSPDTDNLTISYRDCKYNYIQEVVNNYGVYNFSHYGRMNGPKVLHNIFSGAHNWNDCINENNNSNSGCLDSKFWGPDGQLNDEELWEKHFCNNFFVPIDSGWRTDGASSGTFIFCKKFKREDGESEIVPNLVTGISRYELTFSKEILSKPTEFYDLNGNLMTSIQTHIEQGRNNEPTTEQHPF